MPAAVKPLRGVRILSLALNLPGPAALTRLRDMGASCTKVEPPASKSANKGSASVFGDPMALYEPVAYAALHAGIKRITIDLKTDKGQSRLHASLARCDVLLTSFRPSALDKLGLGWNKLHRWYPALSVVAIVGAPGARAEEPGHDLTYLAEAGLVNGVDLPASLFADMGGALMASEAVVKAVLGQYRTGKGVFQEVALSDAAQWLALPRAWGLTQSSGAVGGAHAGYRIYACEDGRVAVAALEPHFAAALCAAAGIVTSNAHTMFLPATRQTIAAYMASRSCQQLNQLALAKDIPLHTMR